MEGTLPTDPTEAELIEAATAVAQHAAKLIRYRSSADELLSIAWFFVTQRRRWTYWDRKRGSYAKYCAHYCVLEVARQAARESATVTSAISAVRAGRAKSVSRLNDKFMRPVEDKRIELDAIEHVLNAVPDKGDAFLLAKVGSGQMTLREFQRLGFVPNAWTRLQIAKETARGQSDGTNPKVAQSRSRRRRERG